MIKYQRRDKKTGELSGHASFGTLSAATREEWEVIGPYDVVEVDITGTNEDPEHLLAQQAKADQYLDRVKDGTIEVPQKRAIQEAAKLAAASAAGAGGAALIQYLVG